MEKLLNRKEVAGILGVSLSTICRLQKSGELVFAKIGGEYKLSHADLQAYYERRKVAVIKVKSPTAVIMPPTVKPIGKNRKGLPLYV